MTDILLGLIGDNIASSSAPRLHKLAGQQNQIEVRYNRLVPTELDLDFKGVFSHCVVTGYRGINVTYPYKEIAAAMVKVPDPLTKSVGAVNTVLFETSGPVGFNTDLTGFVSAYQSVMMAQSPGIVCMVGTGGVGRAVAFGLVSLGAKELRLYDRDLAKAETLASALETANEDILVSVCGSVEVATSGADGLINCTPVGMVGYEGTAIPNHLMSGASWAFDAVYTPVSTQFLQDAEAQGLRIISGYELFFYQGVHAWKIFADKPLNETKLRQDLAQPQT